MKELNLENEIWRPSTIDGFEISNYARLRREETKVIIKQHLIKGRWLAIFSKKYKKVNVTVSREAAKAFIPNPNNYPDVLHLKSMQNDHISNLKWGKRERKGRRPTLTQDEVKDVENRNLRGWTIEQMAEHYNVSISCIKKVINKK